MTADAHLPKWTYALVPIALLVFGGAAYFLTGSSGEDVPDPDALRSSANAECRVQVEDRLKAPGSADFSIAKTTNVGDEWTVRGDVDAENSFGAKLRNSYTCVLNHAGGDDWRVVAVEIR